VLTNRKTNEKQMKLTVVATAEDQASGEFFATVEYLDIRGGVRGVQVPLAELTDPRALKKLLINAGAYLSDDDDESADALHMLKAQAENVKQSVFAPKLGWYGDGLCRFVRPNGVVGKQLKNAKLRPPRQLSAHVSDIGTKGTHEGWMEKVAKPAASSSRMVLEPGLLEPQSIVPARIQNRPGPVRRLARPPDGA
jgi:Domain of unknown function (DUF927)